MQEDERAGPFFLFPFSFLLLLLALVMLLPGMGISLVDRDEGWYAQVSREMLETGDWLVPRYLGEVWLAKPPLLYWLVASSFSLLGMGEWQARLVPVLASAANVLLVAALAGRMFNRRVGFLAGVLFATFGLQAIVGKMLLTDAVMLTCTLAAVLLHWEMASRGVSHLRAGGYWLFIGLGILAKGPAILFFAGAFALALLFSRRDGWSPTRPSDFPFPASHQCSSAATGGGRYSGSHPESEIGDRKSGISSRRQWLLNWRWWLWLPVAAVVAAPWYAHMATYDRQTLVDQFLWYEFLSRITTSPHGHTGPPGYHLLLSLAGLLPWTLFVPGALIETARNWRQDPNGRLLLVWLAVPWIVLELISSKLPHYILPCYVPLAILLARSFEPALFAPRPFNEIPRREQRLLRLWPGILIVVGVIGMLVAVVFWNPLWTPAGVGTAGVLAMGFVLTGRVLIRRGLPAAFTAAVVATVAFHVAVGLWLLPSFEPLRVSRELAEAVNATARPGDRIVFCGYNEPSVYFYLDAPGRPLRPAEAAALLAPAGAVEVEAQFDSQLGFAADASILLAISQRTLDEAEPEVAAILDPQRAGVPVTAIQGFNYAKMQFDTVWLVRYEVDRS